MNLYFADRLLDVKGMASTAISSTYQVINDRLSEELQNGVKILEFDIRYRNNSDISSLKIMMSEGNYILYDGVLGQSCFTAIEVEHDPIEKNFHIYAEDAGLDLINETRSAFEIPIDGPKPIEYYTERILSEDWEIGINEIPDDKTMSISWSGEQTATERLASLATYFDAELAYRFEFRGLLITKKYLDIYKRRGKDVFQELRLGREIENIVEKRSIANLATALIPTGDPLEIDGQESDPISLDNMSYDDGDFYIYGRQLRSRVAAEKWGRYNVIYRYNTDYTVRPFYYETTDKIALRDKAIEELKKRREPEVTYQVSLLYLPENLSIGDTVYLVDDASELYLSARLLKIEISESNDTRTAEFGDYVVKNSGILDRFIEVAKELQVKPKYTWIAYADGLNGNGISTDPTGKLYIGIAANRTTPTPILDPTLYSWSLRKNVITEWDTYDHWSSGGDSYYTIETDSETGDRYVVINGSGERYLIYEDEHGYEYYINSAGRTVYLSSEGILVPMDEDEYDEYVDENTSRPGIHYVDITGGTVVRIVSEKINTQELSINGVPISDYITSQVGYRVIDYTYTYSINANSSINITASHFQISTPEGYSPVSVLAARSGDGRVVVRTFNGAATSSAQALCLRNVSEDNLTNLEAHLAILYFSTSLSGGGGGGGGGGIGTLNYNDLLNKPQLDEVTLQGNRDLYITNTEIDNLINLTIPGV